MVIQKSEVKNVVNLQNGMFCHFTPEHLIISEEKRFLFDKNKIQLHKTRNVRTWRIVFNIIYTLLFISVTLYTNFYPLILLLFVSLWDLKQLKRYYLPINKSRIIPIENITHFEIKRGSLGLNYLYVFLEHNQIKSFIPLKLYDSESTTQYAVKLAESTGKEVIQANSGIEQITGDFFSTSDAAGYVLTGQKMRYIEHQQYNPDRIDNYQYLRIFALVLMGIGTTALILKIYMMVNGSRQFVDYCVLILILFILRIPFPYLTKALPNGFELNSIVSIQERKKKYILTVKQGWLPLKIHFRKKLVGEEIKKLLEHKI